MKFNLYYAGQGYTEVLDYIKQEKGCKLFTNDGERKWIKEWVAEKKEGKIHNLLFVDSGAYTAFTKKKTIDINEYIEFVNSLGVDVDYFANLDVIPGVFGHDPTREEVDKAAEESFKNFVYIRKRATFPTKVLPVFHQGEDFKWLKQMLEYKDECGLLDYICLGGGADKSPKEREAWYRKVFAFIEESKNPKVKVHCLGTSSTRSLELFPFYSADATSWARAAAFGRIFTKFGTVLVSGMQDNDPDHISMNEIGLPVLKEYLASFGFDLDDMIYDNVEKGTRANITRMKWNIKFLQNWAENYEYKGPSTFRTNRLFTRRT